MPRKSQGRSKAGRKGGKASHGGRAGKSSHHRRGEREEGQQAMEEQW